MKILVVGLGNPILGDDGIGWRVAQRLEETGNLTSDMEVTNLSLGGISLMESLVGYDIAIIIDAIATHRVPIGTIRRISLDDLSDPSAGHLGSVHDTSLQNAIKIGRDLNLKLPKEIIVVAIEARKIYDFSEELSPEVAASIPEAVRIILELLSSIGLPDNDE